MKPGIENPSSEIYFIDPKLKKVLQSQALWEDFQDSSPEIQQKIAKAYEQLNPLMSTADLANMARIVLNENPDRAHMRDEDFDKSIRDLNKKSMSQAAGSTK